MNLSKLIACICTLLLSVQLLQAQQWKDLTSPDGKLVYSFSLSLDGVPSYSITYRQKPFILSSALGIAGWVKGLVFTDVAFSNQDTTWKPVYGERSQVRDHYQQMIITFLLNNNKRNKFQVQVRAYDEGIAFRYIFPENPVTGNDASILGGMDVSIKKELTEFTVPAGAKAWFTNRAQGAYNLLPLTNWPDEAERPLVLQMTDGKYACLAEAAMVDYARTKFSLDTVKANNDLLLNLNTPCEISNTSRIQPGKIMREMTLTMKGSKDLVDFAVKRHLQYIHFDVG